MNKTQIILCLIDDGMTAKQISEVMECHVQLPYGVARRYGKTIAGAKETPLAKYDEQIRRMRAEGKTIPEIAEAIGSNKYHVRWYCRSRNITIPEAFKVANQHKNRYTEDDARRIIAAKNPHLEYISGYTRNKAPVTVRCLICNKEFDVVFGTICNKGGGVCPHCRKKAIEDQRAEKERAKAAERERAEKEKELRKAEREQKQLEEKERKRKEQEHPCSVCGTITSRPTYCSDKCAKKAKNSRKEAARRARISNQLVDKDITLESLFKRDKGVCHICGDRCDYEDYTVMGGVFVAGDWYPSIDHVVALSNGGKHSWSNVRLAHRLCNTKKIKQIIPRLHFFA